MGDALSQRERMETAERVVDSLLLRDSVSTSPRRPWPPGAFRSLIETTLLGPVTVTRAALPQLRAQHSGLVMTISSIAGITSPVEFTAAYATSKLADAHRRLSTSLAHDDA